MTDKTQEALKLALEALRDYRRSDDDRVSVAMGILQEALASEANEQCVCGEPNTPGTHRTDGPCLAEQPAQQQQPVAYDKTELNCFAQDLYDQKMCEGKHGHYESMFHVIHQCIKKVSPQASRPWVGLTDEQILNLVPGLQDCLCDPWDYNNSGDYYASIPKDMIRLARAIEAAHGIKEKNHE